MFNLLNAFVKQWINDLRISNEVIQKQAKTDLFIAKKSQEHIDLLQAIALVTKLDPNQILTAIEATANQQVKLRKGFK